MPRYYFQIHDGISTHDTEGTELPDLAEARRAAIDVTAEVLKRSRDRTWHKEGWQLDVNNGDGVNLLTVTVKAEMAADAHHAAKPNSEVFPQD